MFVVQIIATIICAVFAVWVFGGIYYDVEQRARWGLPLAVSWLVVVTLLLFLVRPYWLALVIVFTLCLLFLAWWLTQKPSHDRDWDPNFSQLPRFTVDGDTLTATNVRNTEYRSLEDYDLQYETRTWCLSDLRAIDIGILYWGSPWMCHPLAIFDFGDDQHLCFSIEVRYRRGEVYDIVRGLYRQNEIMMVVSDERDAILRRTKYSEGQDIYLYRMQKGPEFARELLDTWVAATNAVYDEPRWYNAVTWNCTTTIYWMRRGQIRWDWRMLFNGKLDRMLYDWDRLYRGMPFDELKPASLINDRANAASPEEFSRAIRDGLPGFNDEGV